MSAKRAVRKPPATCPVCGEDVPPRALACPGCGADYETGWKEDSYDGLDLPDDNFDYDEFVEKEFGDSSRPPGVSPVVWVVAIILVIAFLLTWVL